MFNMLVRRGVFTLGHDFGLSLPLDDDTNLLLIRVLFRFFVLAVFYERCFWFLRFLFLSHTYP